MTSDSLTQQLLFPFQAQDDYTPTSFVVGEGVCAVTHSLMEAELSTTYGFFLQGESGSGKTHLAHCWSNKVGAKFLTSSDIEKKGGQSQVLSDTSLVLDELTELSPDGQENLFHLLNALKEKHHKILVVSQKKLPEISLSLPDLISRLKTLPMLEIEPPDEEHMEAIIVKRFSDFNMTLDPKVPAYLAMRLPRDYAGVQKFIFECVRYAFEQKKKVTVPLVASLLDKNSTTS